MELNVNILTNATCSILIEDKTEYLAESNNNTIKGKFRKSDTIAIDTIRHNKLKEAEYYNTVFTLPTEYNTTIPVKLDGWFTVMRVVLPSEKWFVNQKKESLGIYQTVYYTDGKSIYKYFDGKAEAVTLQEVLAVNPKNTTISKIEKEYVSICFLEQCYIGLCLQIFEGRGVSPCWTKNKIDSELVYKRDLVWMAINVIKYLTKHSQLMEAERIVEVINGCNGLCKPGSFKFPTNTFSSSGGCGCGNH